VKRWIEGPRRGEPSSLGEMEGQQTGGRETVKEGGARFATRRLAGTGGEGGDRSAR